MGKKTKIVILGAGYGGIRAAQRLSEREDFETVLIDQHPYHYLQTEVYDFIANKIKISDVAIDLFALCAGFGDNVSFLKDFVIDIDFESKKVILLNKKSVSYDFLIIALGAKTAFMDEIEGLKEYSRDIKDLQNALIFKHKFEDELFDRIETEGSLCTRKFNIVVGGAGLSGVEIAAEMACYAKEFYKSHKFVCENLNIYLVSATPTILPGLPEKVVKLAQKRLNKLGIKTIFNAKITKVNKKYVRLSTDAALEHDFLIFTGGVRGVDLVEKLDVEKNRKLQIVTDEYLRVAGKEVEFAIGDIAQIKDTEGNIAPQTADIAEQSAELAVHNIICMVDNKEMKKSDLKSRGMLIALGGKYAIGRSGNFVFSGFSAYIAKQGIFKIYKLPLLKKADEGFSKISK
ncbi:NAD(P)/FAD-dependent oxidoreductase [Nitrosophilus alvini]|uniref:NAD(P)/FAD-dependent oxidoreductase n=1 Tax=Nitrosophilus alvini TaxID=2714855 RepID=UPI00190DD336|nr:NAD(P)/FAD-dependent oxidoreductase [Nitrosophilus alvini]